MTTWRLVVGKVFVHYFVRDKLVTVSWPERNFSNGCNGFSKTGLAKSASVAKAAIFMVWCLNFLTNRQWHRPSLNLMKVLYTLSPPRDGNESGISILKKFKKHVQEKTRPAHLHPTSSHSNLSLRFQLSRWHSISDDHRVRKKSPWLWTLISTLPEHNLYSLLLVYVYVDIN